MNDELTHDTDEDILKAAKDRWGTCDAFYSEQYEQADADYDFAHGVGQWDDAAQSSRSKEGRPTLVLNQMLPYVHQITNDIKQARLAIRVVPIDDKADIDTAEIRAGIIRNIEKQSKAKDVYGTAAKNAISAGIGWIEVEVDYADTDTFDKEAYIRRVLDYRSCMLDPQSTAIDGSDAHYGFKRFDYTKERFEEIYPDASPVSFEGVTNEDNICVVVYYYRECEKKNLHQVLVEFNQETVVIDDDKLKEFDEAELAYEKVATREVDEYTTYCCVLSGEDVLSKEEFPSQYIPLIPVIGEEVFLDGKREFHSLIRQGKDAQRMYNYWKSMSTEMIALQPKAPWVGAKGSFKGNESKWASANTQNHAFLEYEVIMDENGQRVEPPQRSQPSMGNPAMMQEAVGAREDIRLALGMPQANMGERTNVISGIALGKQQTEGDNSTFHFVDNLSSSIEQVGRILNEIIPAIYSERKVQRIIGDTGEEENVPVNTPFVKGEEGVRPARPNETPTGVYDLSVGKYDIDIDIGASYSSRRQETAGKMFELLSISPELISVIGDLAIEATDLPMAKQIAARLRAQMPPEVLEDDPMAAKLQQAAKQMEQMQEQLQNFEAALADKSKDTQFDQQAQTAELELKRKDLQIKAAKTAAEIEAMRAETKGFKADAAQSMIGIQQQIQDMSDTINIMMDAKEVELNGVSSAPPEAVEQSIEDVTQ